MQGKGFSFFENGAMLIFYSIFYQKFY